MEEFVSIGKLIKTHGLAGDITLRVEGLYESDLLVTEKIFLEHHGQKIPYFIDSIKQTNPLQIKLEDIESPEMAHVLTHKTIYLNCNDVTVEQESNSELEYSYLIGYSMYNSEERLFLGVIKDIISYPNQELALIDIDNKEILIPIVDSFIIDIKRDLRKIFMSLPEGILSL